MVQRMRPIAAEKGTVKLVHPGRHVEILKEPVTVAEVMSKNPRHCITRPDVFKFPWIVMKPESVLPTGKVFLLVPNHTVYDLMKSENHRNPSPPVILRKILTVDRKPKTTTTTNSPPKAYAGTTPKHQDHHRNNKNNPSLVINDTSFGRRTTTTSRNTIRHQPEQDSGNRLLTPWLDEPKLMTPKQQPYHRMNKPSTVRNDTSFGSTTSCNTNREWENDSVDRRLTPWMDERNSFREFQRQLMAENSEVERLNAVMVVNGGDEGSSSSGQRAEVAELKSCMRKPDSVRKSLGLRVSFVLPNRVYQERRNRQTVRRAGFGDYLNW